MGNDIMPCRNTRRCKPVGVVKNLAYMAHILLLVSNSQPIYDVIEKFIIKIEDLR